MCIAGYCIKYTFNGCVAAMDTDSDSGSDFGGFASDDLGGNGHIAAALGTTTVTATVMTATLC